MSTGKFAAITSSLLARKGEAAPWNDNGREALDWRHSAPVAIMVPPPFVPPAAIVPPPMAQAADHGALKRCTVRLSAHDYERLGIMAVKQDLTRQQFLQTALARVLDEIAREFPGGCACIGERCGACAAHPSSQ